MHQVGEPDNKRRVLEATDIVRLIGDHVTLKPKGREFGCLCPFHNDHNPSMYVVPAKQIFHCFVCGAGGNALDFVMRFHGMGFRQALEFLAERAGIEIVSVRSAPSARGGAGGAGESSRDEIHEANASAMRFFRGVLAHAEHGAAARAVIARRGISDEMVESFGIGAAPDRWDGLASFARSKSLELRPFIDAGLIKKRESSEGCYDLLRHRLVFTIFDLIGRPIAFGGRKLRDEDEPKYLNSPESKVFDKSSTLFGLKQALRSIQSSRTAVVTEGYTDVIACHQHGFTNVVATLGTAFTPKHASILCRYCDSLVLLFDGDEAGQRAADRALEVVFKEPLDVRVASISGGKDPDELLKLEGGNEKFRAMLSGAIDVIEYWFVRLRDRLDREGKPVGSAARDSEITAAIKRWFELGLGNLPLLRQHSIEKKVWRLSGADGKTIERVFAAERAKSRLGPAGPETKRAAASRRGPAESALGCLLCEPTLAQSNFEAIEEIAEALAYSSPPSVAAIAASVSARAARRLDTGLEALLDEFEDGATREAATALFTEVHRVCDGSRERITKFWKDCLDSMKQEQARRTLEELSKSAAGPSDDALMNDSALARLRLSQQLHQDMGGNPRALPRPRVVSG